jgi:CYTH domain-containing protein/CHAD domain-containing protein
VTDSELPLTATDLDALLASALTRSAHEGARIVALHWLYDLLDARAEWDRLVDEALHAADRDDARREAADRLHKARVALRRLRATLREHRRALDLDEGRRIRRALKRLGRSTNTLRDRDAQREWLTAEREGLPPAVQAEADVMLGELDAHASRLAAQASRAFARALDRHAVNLVERLANFSLPQRVGHVDEIQTFARHLADRVERGAAQLARDLALIDDVHADGALHRVRLRLKQQRAMLAPFARALPAVDEWYALATQGQDLLGAMRDARLLAERADDEQLHALADALRVVALGDFAAFSERWTTHSDEVTRILRRAVQALREYQAVPAIPSGHGLPMEIERKFLLHGLPPTAATAPSILIEQGWLPGTMLRERLRRTVGANGITKLTRTVKLGRAGTRIEVEELTDAALFTALWPITVSARVRKRRHMVPAGELLWEIDVFLDRDLVLAEVELKNEAQAVSIPEWLAPFVVKEVTNDPSYLNSVMAQRDVASPDNATV